MQEDSEIAVPDQYACPISKRIMLTPVYGPDGVRYDRPHILRWLKTKETSPCTNMPLRADELVADPGLARRIRDFMQRDARTTVAMLKSFMMTDSDASPGPEEEDTLDSLLRSTIAFYEEECAREASASEEAPADKLLREGHLKLEREGALFSLELDEAEGGGCATALWDMHIAVAAFRTMAEADSSDDDVEEEFRQTYESRTQIERLAYDDKAGLTEILSRLVSKGYCILAL